MSYRGCVFHRVVKDFAVIGGDIAVRHNGLFRRSHTTVYLIRERLRRE